MLSVGATRPLAGLVNEETATVSHVRDVSNTIDIVADGTDFWKILTIFASTTHPQTLLVSPGESDSDGITLPDSCRIPGGRSLVYDGQVWVDCTDRVIAFAPSSAHPRTIIQAPGFSGLFAAAATLWVETNGAVVGIAGEKKGAEYRLPRDFVPTDDYAAQVAWASSGDSAWALGVAGEDEEWTIVAMNLKTGRTVVAPLKANILPVDIVAVGSEVWIADAHDLTLQRYDQRTLEPIGAINVSAGLRTPLTSLNLESTERYVWLSLSAGGSSVVRRFEG